MLDRFLIFTKTGLILFDYVDPYYRGNPSVTINYLITEILLGTRHTSTDKAISIPTQNQSAKLIESSGLGIYYVAVYANSIAGHIAYVDSLLAAVERRFMKVYSSLMEEAGKNIMVLPPNSSSVHTKLLKILTGATVLASQGTFTDFRTEYEQLLEMAETRTDNTTTNNNTNYTNNPVLLSKNNNNNANSSVRNSDDNDNHGKYGNNDDEEDTYDDENNDPELQEIMKSMGGTNALLTASPSRKNAPTKGGKTNTNNSSSNGNRNNSTKGTTKNTPTKKERDWGGNYTASAAATLDKSKDKPSASSVEIDKVQFTGDSQSGSDYIIGNGSNSSSNGDLSAAFEEKSNSSSGVTGWLARSSLGSWFSSVTGSKTLEKPDIEPIVENLRAHLQEKNVAKGVADALTNALITTLEGTKLESGGAITSVQTKIANAANKALRDAIERILTPHRPVDVLRDVRAKSTLQAAKPVGHRDPFVIVFCGVNGVGKSTTLAKVAYHLKDNAHSPLIAACDTFRSAAVEQLKLHCDRLQVPLFERGYQKNASEVASSAIRQAKETNHDVVLVDTAGRMQNNRTLMAELAQLVAVTKPDLVLFVGEALVGNDGVDQLEEFSRSLIDQAVDNKNPRRIDGIVLTKFDTVDDKVGMVLSMVHKTGIPIAFLGVGQQYPDLRKLNVNSVVSALLA